MVRAARHRTAPFGEDKGTGTRMAPKNGRRPVSADHEAGSSTLSITWMTPFDCITSAMVTVAALP